MITHVFAPKTCGVKPKSTKKTSPSSTAHLLPLCNILGVQYLLKTSERESAASVNTGPHHTKKIEYEKCLRVKMQTHIHPSVHFPLL